MDRFSHLELRSLIEQSKAPCVSIYLPAHRVKEEAQQDPIRLKNLLRQVERHLADAGLEPAEVVKMLEPAQGLLDDRTFWQHQADGLALFLCKGCMRSYRLPLRFEEQVVVSNQFCLRPLFPLLTGDGEFYLLALSQKAVKLFKGSRFHMAEMPLRNVPANLAAVTQHEERQRLLQVRTGPRSGGDRGMYYGHGDGGDIKRDGLMEYFRLVNRGLRETLGDTYAPLVLAAVESHFPLYREANTYPNLADEGVTGNPDEASTEDLHQQAWEILASLFHREQREATATYERLAGTGRTAGSVASILPAAYHGRVESLFLPAGRTVWGRFEPETGEVTVAEGPANGSLDLLNLAAILTHMQKGTVYTVAPGQVPGNGEAAALLRY